ncbi:MAG TPA: hypothetical protein VGQ46_07380 [Thermoanaerobaculia bacterium]|jgi:hypothetical protein|nr:hypothetical protein [Thermoanaerobaculia bacterium]
MLKRFLLLAFLAVSLQAAPPAYHLELVANPATPFPFLGKFGTVTLHVYPNGVRAETFWLNGFSRNGTNSVTVENPLGRMYTDVPVTQISATLHKIATSGMETAAPGATQITTGTVKGMPARRYRLVYGPEAWIDIWTTDRIPENAQLRAIINEFVRGISPATAASMDAIHGTPLYVELNFRRYKKMPLLTMKNLTWTSAGQDDALKVGKLYFKAPLLDAIWK